MSAAHPVVVLTPVRNEAWILRRFLEVTSRCADRILVADQRSSDGSREICSEYPRVTLIENEAAGYDEGDRQELLLETARRLFPGPKVLLALDADEILAADATASAGWRRMRTASPGTVVEVELCDLFQGVDQCIRYDALTALGYVDDGARHRPSKVHSVRVPTPALAPHLRLPDVTVMHYALTRLDAYRSRKRFYSVIENVLGTSHVLRRRHGYAADFDFSAAESLQESGGRIEPTPPAWLEGWEDQGVDLRTIPKTRFYWHDFEVLRYFRRYGVRRFWLDDIWGFDWNSCRAAAPAWLPPAELPPEVRSAPASLQLGMRAFDFAYRFYARARRRARLGKALLQRFNDPANVRLP